MRQRDFEKLGNRLIEGLPNLGVKGRLIFLRPLKEVLSGFYFDASGSSKTHFYFWVFFLPLCVPYKTLHFTFGKRLGKHQRWNAESPDLEQELAAEMMAQMPFLTTLTSADGVVAALEEQMNLSSSSHVNPYRHEALGYMLIKGGNVAAARRILEELIDSLKPEALWEQEIVQRATLIQSKLALDRESALLELVRFESTTSHNLGLQDQNPAST